MNLAGKFLRQPNVRAATERVNGGIAGTIVESFRHLENAVMVNIFMPCELIHAMGLTPMFPEGLSAYIVNTACEEVFVETSEAHDIAETFCSYHKLMMGVAETGVMPKPLMIANTTLICDANQLSFPRLVNFYDVPHYVIDVPNTADGDAVAYVTDQLYEFAACEAATWEFPQEDFIALLGGRVSPQLQRSIEQEMSLAVVNLTCCGSRGLEALPEDAASLSFPQLMEWYAHALLRQVPCMRMTDVSGRRVLFENPHLKGIVYNTVKFCDFYSFDYAALKNATALLMLKIESDCMPMAAGQLSTRLEAFSESMGLATRQRKENNQYARKVLRGDR